jgi:tight adherence protein B
MLLTIGVVVAIAAGVSLPAVAGVLALVVAGPFGLVAVGFAGPAWLFARRRKRERRTMVDEARFCGALSAELHAGASLRHALAAAAARGPGPDLERLAGAAMSGEPAVEVAALLELSLPEVGRHAAHAFALASETGAAPSHVFDRLTEGALHRADLRRERRTLTAQARLSAYVVGGAPVAIVALLFATGRISLDGLAGAQGVVMGAGLALVAAGLALVGMMLKRAA